MKKGKTRVVSETNIGIYVFRLPNGDYVMDDELRVLSIAATRGDIQKMKELTLAAKVHGFDEGTCEFVEGARKVSDEEFILQYDRFMEGYIPDPYDIGNMQDMWRYGK